MITQHYVFAHRALPSVTFQDPTRMLAVLCGPDATRLLHDLWEQAGSHCSPEGKRTPEGLSVEAGRAGSDSIVAVIRLPSPGDIGEAHFVALVAKLASPDAPSLDKLAYTRCFTLERGVDFRTDQPCTFLCEWAEDGKHVNHGVGPAISEDAFVQAIFAELADDNVPEA